MTPEQRELSTLQELLSAKDFAGFVRRIGELQATQTFETQEQQNDFIGEIALLVGNCEALEPRWRARIAGQLGVRENENLFAPQSRYWSAYQQLLDHYAAFKAGYRQTGRSPGIPTWAVWVGLLLLMAVARYCGTLQA
jgi:hypothetical protein